MNEKYKTVQISVEDYELLKDYCDAMGLKLGRFMGKLIRENCLVRKPNGRVLLVEETGNH